MKKLLTVGLSGDYIIVSGERAGTLRVKTTRNLDKRRLLRWWASSRTLVDLFAQVPDDFDFNYYWVEELYLDPEYRGQNVATMALDQLIDRMDDPAMIALEIGILDRNVSHEQLVRFYQRHGFHTFSEDTADFGVAFVKLRGAT